MAKMNLPLPLRSQELLASPEGKPSASVKLSVLVIALKQEKKEEGGVPPARRRMRQELLEHKYGNLYTTCQSKLCEKGGVTGVGREG